jgi:two-component system sensor histidine kinase PhoQ
MRSLLDENDGGREKARINAQIERMDEIVRYQLRKPAAATESLVLATVVIKAELDKLVAGMRKVYREKNPDIDVRVATGARFRGDSGDFLELAGNLLDNACKWCRGQVSIAVTPLDQDKLAASGMILTVGDDGKGIPASAAEILLQRGTRLDETHPGHGIGLAIVADIARSYGGEVRIGTAPLGGAEITVVIP